MQRNIELCGKNVRYELERKKVKNINLRIKADGTVSVSAPRRIPEGMIEDFMCSKGDYIIAALEKFAQAESIPFLPRAYSDGEQICLLGSTVTLSFTQGKSSSVRRQGDMLILTLKNPADPEQRRRVLDEYLRARCEEAVNALCEEVYPKFQALGVKFPEIKLRRMKSRWGSCAPAKGALTFNTALSCVPLDCVEYVVAHEFTHFHHPDHSAAFYNTLARIMPDWQQRRQRLNNRAIY